MWAARGDDSQQCERLAGSDYMIPARSSDAFGWGPRRAKGGGVCAPRQSSDGQVLEARVCASVGVQDCRAPRLQACGWPVPGGSQSDLWKVYIEIWSTGCLKRVQVALSRGVRGGRGLQWQGPWCSTLHALLSQEHAAAHAFQCTCQLCAFRSGCGAGCGCGFLFMFRLLWGVADAGLFWPPASSSACRGGGGICQ